MSSTTTVNVTNNCDQPPPVPGTFQVRARYNETDDGHVYGPFTDRLRAEQCLLILAGRSDVIRANIEEA